MLYLKADYTPNASLSTSKKNKNHDEIQTRIKQAETTNSLHLSSLNIDYIFSSVFSLTSLQRLDLSHNNLVRINDKIGVLEGLTQLWLNDNPLREIPVSVSNLTNL